MKKFLSYLSLLPILLIIAFILNSIFFEAYKIPSGSMEDTILPGDYIIVNKFIYGSTTPKYLPFTNIEIPFINFESKNNPLPNEVIVFETNDLPGMSKFEENQKLIKRCIALPGDTLQIINNKIFINHKKLETSLKYDSTRILGKTVYETNIYPNGFKWNRQNYGPLIIPKKGKNILLDSKNIRTYIDVISFEKKIKNYSIYSNSIVINNKRITEYTFENDYYFVMGNNSDNSFDSRYWGFLPRHSIIGRASFIYLSLDPEIIKKGIWHFFSASRWERIFKSIN